MTPTAQYLDGAAFTRLFLARRRNHAAICLGLQQIVKGVSTHFWYPAGGDVRRDHEANALLYTIERINRFKPGPGRNAFSYFTQVIFNRLRWQRRQDERRLGRAIQFCDLEELCGFYMTGTPDLEILHTARSYAQAS